MIAYREREEPNLKKSQIKRIVVSNEVQCQGLNSPALSLIEIRQKGFYFRITLAAAFKLLQRNKARISTYIGPTDYRFLPAVEFDVIPSLTPNSV